MTVKEATAQRIHTLVREGFVHRFGQPRTVAHRDSEWEKLRRAGTHLWLDTGDVAGAAALWCSEFEALTTNNTLLNAEVQKGIYDDLIRKAATVLREAQPDIDERTLILEVAFVLNARHGLRLVDEFDAFVSVELHTDLAGDVERTVEYGRRFFAICPERFYVKVPLTPAGLLGARRLGQLGIPVNFTLGFSARQNYVAALIAQPRYVNVFLGRLNAFVADSQLGTGENAGEKATLATQRAITALRSAGRTKAQLIAASMREGTQVASLAGVDVMTMPLKVAAQYRKTPAPDTPSATANDPAVPLAAGSTLRDLNGASLWEVPDGLKGAVDALLKRDVDRIGPEDVRKHFEKAGFGDLLPDWSDDEVRTIAADGKIPVYSKWKGKLSAGALGLDALMNLCGLQSFVTDEKALDARVKSFL